MKRASEPGTGGKMSELDVVITCLMSNLPCLASSCLIDISASILSLLPASCSRVDRQAIKAETARVNW